MIDGYSGFIFPKKNGNRGQEIRITGLFIDGTKGVEEYNAEKQVDFTTPFTTHFCTKLC